MNLGQGIIGDEDARVLTVQRTAVGSYVDGVYVEGAVSSFQTSVIVVPIDGEARMRQPEGSRSQESIRFFAPVLLRTSRDDARQVADKLVDVDGRRWLVDAVDDWINMAGYCDCMAVALAATPEISTLYFGSSVSISTEADVLSLASSSYSSLPITLSVLAGPGAFSWIWIPTTVTTFTIDGFVGGYVLVDVALVVGGVAGQLWRSTIAGTGNYNVELS